MGLQAEITPADRLTALAGGSWAVALPSTRIGADAADRWAASQPYYHWPIFVVVPAASDAQSLDDLSGLRVCAVAGSTGEAWLAGRPDVIPLARPDEAACLEALATGMAAATVTADVGPADIKVRGDVRALGPPVTSEPRSVLGDRQAGDPTALIHEIDGAIQSARDDGTLADLSRRYFGGFDLTVAPAEPQETSR
jgi:ABC-type amino acid transport substrate-binding protein